VRKSLLKSVAESPVKGFERYAKHSIVLCNSCASPLFLLETGISLGDKCGQMADRFKPITIADLNVLAGRDDIDAGVKAMLAGWDQDQRKAHCDKLHEVHTGDPMVCPICTHVFVQVLAVERDEVVDRAYTVELVTIPPFGQQQYPLRGKDPTRDRIH
jgi:hypothetical protein